MNATIFAYRSIQMDMRRKVEEGAWPAGIMIPSRKALCKSYGVKLGTIQKAIESLLSDGTLKAESGRGTFVPRDERAERDLSPQRRSQLTIAVVLDRSFSSTDPGPRAILHAIHATIRRAATEIRLLTFDTHADSIDMVAALERDALHWIEQAVYAGVIIWHAGGSETEPLLKRAVDRDIPIVFVDRCPSACACDFVGLDNVDGARDAVDYLLGLGHKRIGFLAPLERISPWDQRREGYRAALQRAGIDPMPELEFRACLPHNLNVADLYVGLQAIAKTIEVMPDPPSAIFAVNDFQAHHLIVALELQGLCVPSDISIIGFGDIDRYSPRPAMLTTMRQSFEAMGERAVTMLLQRIAERGDVSGKGRGATPSRHVLLSTQLVVRKSCRSRSG